MSLRAVVLGCGPRGLDHARAVREVEGLHLSGMGDLLPDARERAESSLGVRPHTDLETLLRETDPQIVVIATPPFVREEPVATAAAHPSVVGILVEKPFALQLSEAERMIEACDSQGTLLTVGHHLRYAPHFAAMKEVIDSGELGTVEFLRGAAFGDLVDQGGHLIDAMRWLLGDAAVFWAMSQRGDRAAGRLPGAVLDGGEDAWIPPWTTHYLAFAGGARGVVETGPLHQRSQNFVDEWLDKRITVIGSEGVAESTIGGDCRVLSAGTAEWRVFSGGMRSNLAATREFHAALRDAVQGIGEHRADAHRILPSLEAVLACAQSVVDGDAVTLPLALDRDPLSELIAAPARPRDLREPRRRIPDKPVPELTVIITLRNHRGYAPRTIRAITQQQTLQRSRYEVIVASPGDEPELEKEVEALLGEPDRLIRWPGLAEVPLYDAAAREASGELLWFGEPHAIPDPEALEELVAYMARTDYDAACCHTVGLAESNFCEQQDEFYDRGFAEWTRPGGWARVILRGFAIYRDVYFEAGGFEGEYGRFVEYAMAAKLRSTGRQIGYAAGCTVHHANPKGYPGLVPDIVDFASGEVRYRADNPSDYCELHFGPPGEGEDPHSMNRSAARAAVRLSLRGLIRARRPRLAASMLSALRGALPTALFGPGPRIARARLASATAHARCVLWRPFNYSRAQRAYGDLHRRVARWARLRQAAALSRERSPLQESTSFVVANLPDDRLFGVYGSERVDDKSFRWAQPVAFFDLPVRPGSYRVSLSTLPSANRDQRDVQALFNGRSLAPDRGENGEIAFRVAASDFAETDEQRLALTCAGFRPSANGSSDARLLGLPVTRIDFSPQEDSPPG